MNQMPQGNTVIHLVGRISQDYFAGRLLSAVKATFVAAFSDNWALNPKKSSPLLVAAV
jgi:hypothetical protein